MGLVPTGRLHHLELWVQDYSRAKLSLGWLLERCGYVLESEWAHGGSWQGAGEYIVLEAGPAVAGSHERRRAGLNHLALVAGPPSNVEALAAEALHHGWTLMFVDKHPHAGGAEHYGAYMENADGFEVELVAV
ncbi:glyoxalase [Arthrobacter alpinus]|uniref:Glyoxalase n=1 Tax=Arthrobacter alpinus TaxID=656366 RepID=A0A0M5LXE4_9MICC|nr:MULTISPECIES: VOC family protein [Arthrobacter]ALE92432.1 glyoxalase [Arthrobacter alpinus]